jgi:hypothetical protein
MSMMELTRVQEIELRVAAGRITGERGCSSVIYTQRDTILVHALKWR